MFKRKTRPWFGGCLSLSLALYRFFSNFPGRGCDAKTKETQSTWWCLLGNFRQYIVDRGRSFYLNLNFFSGELPFVRPRQFLAPFTYVIVVYVSLSCREQIERIRSRGKKRKTCHLLYVATVIILPASKVVIFGKNHQRNYRFGAFFHVEITISFTTKMQHPVRIVWYKKRTLTARHQSYYTFSNCSDHTKFLITI